ncbi:tumor suppressor candidate 2 [Gastrophryne carolinensis]
MGGTGSRARGLWPFSSASSTQAPDSPGYGSEQSVARIRQATPFIFTRRGSMYFDEDGDLAHEFYEETIVTKNGRKRVKLKRIHKNLRPQGTIKLDYPCIHVDFPVVLCEV